MFNKIIRQDANSLTAGNVIGELLWEERPGATYEMHLDVEPTYHRQGVGRSMLEELEAIVKNRKGMSIYSVSLCSNLKASKFFSGVGFTPHLIVGFYGKEVNAYLWVKVMGEPDA